MSNCIIAQSGGPTAVINSSLAGVLEKANIDQSINKIYGSINGIQGILHDQVMDLTELSQNVEKLEILKTTPGMYLGSCRFKLQDPEKDDSQFKIIFSIFEKYEIKYFFYIGGNDSMDTVFKLSKYAKDNNKDIVIMGIPKTIDNDLYGIDHTPGFGSAAKFVATAMLEIAHDTYIYNMESITIVEIMGRNAGWLTASAALARNTYSSAPDLIYLPEIPFSKERFIEDIRRIHLTKKNVIIAVSEGVRDENGEFISASSKETDSFGHVHLSGTGRTLENLAIDSFGCKVRSIELNVLQRSSMHLASLTDVNEAFLLGQKAFEYAISGETGKMVTLNRISNDPYSIEVASISIDKVANIEKSIPLNWISPDKNDVTEEAIQYMKPLIIGEASVKFRNGLPLYADISHLRFYN